MDVKPFEQLGLTIAVGGYLIAGLFYVCAGPKASVWISLSAMLKRHPKAFAAIVLLVSLVAGMFAEVGSDRIVGWTGYRFPIFSSD